MASQQIACCAKDNTSIQVDGFKSLTKGDAASFDLEENPNLKEQSRRAVNVKKLVESN